MTTLARVLVLLITPRLAGSPFAVAGTEGVLCLLALLPTQGLIDEEHPSAAAGDFGLEYQFGQLFEHAPVSRPALLRQKTNHAGAMPGLRANGLGRLAGGHPSAVTDKRSDELDNIALGQRIELGCGEKALDPRQGI